MKAVNLKELGSYSLLFVIASNILLYSSALKTAQGDYYIAFEIMRNMNIQSWLTGNIATLTLLISVIILPLTYYSIHIKAQQTPASKKMKKGKYIFILFILTFALLFIFSLLIEYVLGFRGILAILVQVSLLSAIIPGVLHSIFIGSKKINKILEISSSFMSIILFIGCAAVFKDSAIIGQSCLLQIRNGATEKIATIVPIDYSKDSLKAIFLEYYQESEINKKQASYISVIPVDETFSIYPKTCDSIDLINSEK